MGSNASKSNNESDDLVQKNDFEHEANPDPRSPTPEIIRTPLQDKLGTKHNITKNADLRKTFENTEGEQKLIHNNPILSAVIKNHLQSYDPRSPAQDFERTPIIIPSKISTLTNEKQLLRLENENKYGSPCLNNTDTEHNNSSLEKNELNPDFIIPKKLCDGFFDMTLNDTLKDSEEPLGSSTATNETIEKNTDDSLDKPTKLLETDFEYLDVNKYENSKEDNENSTDSSKTEDEFKLLPQFKILDEDPRSPSIGIERTPIVVAKFDEKNDESVEEMSDDTLIKVLQNTNAELRQVVKSRDKNPEGLLIYEDESTTLNTTPKNTKSMSNNGSRTPLSCMKNKSETEHVRSKSVNTLCDPKNQKSKIPKRVSHIPRLKALSKQVKLNPVGSSVSLKNISKTTSVSGDCENTPPHSNRDRWDKDSSIVL